MMNTHGGAGGIFFWVEESVWVIGDMTTHDKLSESLIISSIHGVANHAQNVKTRQDRFRQIHLQLPLVYIGLGHFAKLYRGRVSFLVERPYYLVKSVLD